MSNPDTQVKDVQLLEIMIESLDFKLTLFIIKKMLVMFLLALFIFYKKSCESASSAGTKEVLIKYFKVLEEIKA